MNENLKKFIQKASEDSNLQDKMIEMNESMLKDAKKRFIKLAEENGFVFTEKDIDELYDNSREVSEDELKAVSGGAYDQIIDGKRATTCFCLAFGGGAGDDLQKNCGCFMGGCGKLTDEGKRLADADEIHWDGRSDAKVALWCAMAGRGWKS